AHPLAGDVDLVVLPHRPSAGDRTTAHGDPPYTTRSITTRSMRTNPTDRTQTITGVSWIVATPAPGRYCWPASKRTPARQGRGSVQSGPGCCLPPPAKQQPGPVHPARIILRGSSCADHPADLAPRQTRQTPIDMTDTNRYDRHQ